MPTRSTVTVLCGVVSLQLLLAPGEAAADEPESAASPVPSTAAGTPAPAASDDGFALYRSRQYRRAAEKFLQAYVRDADPNLLFNIARCYQALGDTDAAIEKYEAFLASSGADDQGRRRAAEAVRLLRQTRSSALPAVARQASAAAATAGDADLATSPGTAPGGAQQGRVASFEIAGLALYRAHDYQHAAEKFLSAFSLEADPNLLFNVARCYAALGDTAAAVEKYQAFLKSSGIDVRDQKRAREALQRLRTADAPAVHAVAATAAGSANGESRAGSGRPGAWAAWIVTGLLVAGSAAVGVAALDSGAKLASARDSFPADGDALKARAATTRTLTLSADALAAAALVAGGVSIYLTFGARAPSSEIKAELGPGTLRLAGFF
jgi:tetratricopeptide (TPR) repeat protein